MKLIHLLVSALFFCSIAAAAMEDLQPHTIVVIVWDLDGNMSVGTAVTFAYGSQSETLCTAEDGSMAFSLLNFDGVYDGAHINVSTMYGAKSVPVNYDYGMTGVTFNEPSEEAAIEAWTALGFIVVAAGGGVYLLRKKKNMDQEVDNMENEIDTRSKLVKDFGVRALFGTIALLGYTGITCICVLTDRMDMVSIITSWYMPLITAMVGFYFGGSLAQSKR